MANPMAPMGYVVPVDITDRANAVLLPSFAALAMLVTYLPLKSFYNNRNFPACNIVFVVGVQNLIIFINAIIWPNGDWTTWWNGKGLCDIEGYIRIPITTALATSLACLTKTLADAINVDRHNFMPTAASRRRALLINILLCWGMPLLQIALYYVVQAGRYVILPVYGCGVQTDNSWPTIVIFLLWAPICSLISAFHACQIIRRLRQHRLNLGQTLSSSGSGFTARRYLKLFILSLSLIFVVVPIEFYFLYLNLPPTYVTYSWSRVHNPISWNPILFLSTSDVPRTQYVGWISIAMSFMVFCFFGFNDDAADTYRKWLCVLGAGKIWPSLKEPREVRSRRGSETTTSWSNRFDLVSKAMHYFEGSRKPSQVTSLGSIQTSDSGQLRKGSQAPSNTITLTHVPTNTTDPLSHSTKSISTPDSSTLLEDIITPAPSPFGTTLTTQQPEPSYSVPMNRGLLSRFRTHINLPYPLFSSPQSPKANKNSPRSKEINLEAQQILHKTSLSTPSTTVSTAIWSNPSPSNPSHAKSLSTSTSASQHEEYMDPLSPKMGTRAYRERERRELEREKRELKKERKKERMTTILADNVQTEVGLNMVGENPSKQVIVKTRLERKEENVGISL